jgi:hypothetical protein
MRLIAYREYLILGSPIPISFCREDGKTDIISQRVSPVSFAEASKNRLSSIYEFSPNFKKL